MAAISRMNLHLRLQHGVLLLSVSGALLTGHGLASLPIPEGVGFDSFYRAHRWAGLTAILTVLYHFVYLLVRGYVEGKSWRDFPLAIRRPDWGELRQGLAFVLGRRGRRPEAGTFRASQKLLFWATVLLLGSLAVSGLTTAFWEGLSGFQALPILGPLAELHRGLSLLLLGTLLWHLHGAFVWDGRLLPQWTWLTGSIAEELAAQKVPGFYRDHLQREKERRESMKSAEEEETEESRIERETVEGDLQEGNRLAREEKFVEALYHYRRALERYPAYSQARYNMAMVLRQMGERSMAIDEFRQFIEDDPFHPLARRAQELIAELEGENQ